MQSWPRLDYKAGLCIGLSSLRNVSTLHVNCCLASVYVLLCDDLALGIAAVHTYICWCWMVCNSARPLTIVLVFSMH